MAPGGVSGVCVRIDGCDPGCLGATGAGAPAEWAIRARLAGIPVVLVIGLIPGLGAVWTMVLVTAVCTGEVLSDLFAANPEFLSAVSASIRVENDG